MMRGEKGAKIANAPENKRSLFVNEKGKLRLVWIWLIAAAVYAAWNFGFQCLWNAVLPAANPEIGMAIRCVGTIVLMYLLAKLLHIHDHHGFYISAGLKWLAVGVAMEIVAAALCLCFDSVRMVSPFGSPVFSWNQLIAVLIIVIECMAAEMLLQTVLYCSARDRISRLASILLVSAAAFLVESGWKENWIGMINVLLSAAMGCLVHDHWGLAGSAGFGIGWRIASNVVLSGFGTGIWNTYHVSEAWLTGGEAGVSCGIIATALYAGGIVWLLLREKKKARGEEKTAHAA